ncbi:MAG: hypothetical protein AAF627_08910 [Myxococcota bacterium]
MARTQIVLIPLLVAATACGSGSDDDASRDLGEPVDTGQAMDPDLGSLDSGTTDLGQAQDMGQQEGLITASIGVSGGTLEAEGVRLVVPEGALAETVEISLRFLQEGEIPEAQRVTGAAVDLGPDGQVFALPVQIIIDDPGPAPNGFTKAVLRLNEVTMTWAPVLEGQRSGEQSVGQLNSFSVYASGLVPSMMGGIQEGEFGCTSDVECDDDLRCGIDYGLQFSSGNMPGNVCVRAHCVNGVRDELEAGVDCGGDLSCGDCRRKFDATTGTRRYGSFPLGDGSPLVDLAADSEGGVFGLFRSGYIVQLDEDGDLLRQAYFIPPENVIEPFSSIALDQQNDIFLVDTRNVSKFDDAGRSLWNLSLTGAPTEIRDIDFDCENNLILVGYYGGAVSVGGAEMLPDLGLTAGFVVKLAPDGSVLHSQGFADMQLEHVVTKTYGRPSIATCDYYVAGHSDGKLTINFTGDPADDIPGSSGTAAAHAPFARFGPDDSLVYAYRIAGSPRYSFDGLRVLMGITMEDFNPILFGAASAVLGGGRGVASGRFWGGRMNRNTGAIQNFFDIGAGANSSNETLAPFETLGSPILVSGGLFQEETLRFFSPTGFEVGQPGRLSFFLISSSNWVQTFDFTTAGGSEEFVMTATAQGRPVVGLSLRANEDQAVEWDGGTFDSASLPGNFATFIAGFDP